MELCTFWPISVEFISKTVEEICQHTTERFSQSIQQNNTSKLDKKNVLDKIAKIKYGPSIPHKDEHCKKLHYNWMKI